MNKRFSGWTEESLTRIKNKETQVLIPPRPKKRRDYPGEIVEALKKYSEYLNPEMVKREYRFLHDRRFMFDIAIPSAKIAIEFEGGLFTKGAHTRGAHYHSDAKKYNLATMHGWRLLRYTSKDVTEQKNWSAFAAEEIYKLFTELKGV